jgi:hypothetical protein
MRAEKRASIEPIESPFIGKFAVLTSYDEEIIKQFDLFYKVSVID